jgi:hypothetical protein
MAGSSNNPGIPWYSWIALVIMLGLGALVFYLTNGLVVASWLRWCVTIVWLVVIVSFGIHDFVIGSDSGGAKDDKPFDYWTIAHGGAGLVFGLWYMPLVFVLLLTICWEIFEWLVPGFGEKEVFLNRAVDVGIAVVLWFLVVIVAMLTTGAPFPLVSSYMH